MSDARTDFFSSGAKESKPPLTRDDFFSGISPTDDAEPDSKQAPISHGRGYMDAEAIRKGGFNPVVGTAEAGLSAGTHLGTDVLGGLSGIVNSLMNLSPTAKVHNFSGQDSADVVRDISSLGYDPRTDSGKKVSEALASNWNPLNWPGVVGQKLGDSAEEAGASPLLSTALRVAPDAATALLGVRGAAEEGLSSGRIPEKTLATPQEKLNAAAAKQSMGAAGAAVDLQKLSPELRVAVEKAVQKTGGAVNPDVLARQIQADSLPVKVRLSEGQARGDERLISLEQNARGSNEAYSKGFKAQNEALVANLRAMRDETGPEVFSTNNVEHADTLIARYKAIDDADRAQISAKYKALEDANGGQLPVNGGKFVEAADAALSKKMKGRYLPAQVRGDMDEFRANAGYMTFEQFENLRTNLATEARSAERQGNGNAAAAINIVRRELEALPMSGENANLKALADDARSAAKARFDRLDADPAYKAAVNDAVPPDAFVQKFVINGARDNVERLSAAMADDPAAAQTLKVATLDHLRKAAGVDEGFNGNFTQAGYNKALQNLEPKLGSLLDAKTAETARNLGDIARYTQFQPKGSFVNNSNTFVAATADYGAHALEGAVNYAAKGLPIGTAARKLIQSRKLTKQAEKTFAPGAGLTHLSDLAKLKEPR